MKIIVNRCFGGYGLSTAVGEWLRDNKGWNILVFDKWEEEMDLEAYDGWTHKDGMFCNFHVGDNKLGDNVVYGDRTNLELIECIEALGEAANSFGAKLEVVQVPDDVEWEIQEYDGIESIHEKHRSW